MLSWDLRFATTHVSAALCWKCWNLDGLIFPVTPVLRSPSVDYVYLKQWIEKVIGS